MSKAQTWIEQETNRAKASANIAQKGILQIERWLDQCEDEESEQVFNLMMELAEHDLNQKYVRIDFLAYLLENRLRSEQ